MQQGDEDKKRVSSFETINLAKQLIGGYIGRADVRRRESQKRALTVDISPENAAHNFIAKIAGRKRECVQCKKDERRTPKRTSKKSVEV